MVAHHGSHAAPSRGGGSRPTLTKSATLAATRAWLADIGLPGVGQRGLGHAHARSSLADVSPRQPRKASPAVARAAVYAPDERQAMLLLLLPFLLMAAAIGINQSVRYAQSLPDVAAVTPAKPAPPVAVPPAERLAAAIRATPRTAVRPSTTRPDNAPVPALRTIDAEARPSTLAADVPAAAPLAAGPVQEATVAAASAAPSSVPASLAAPPSTALDRATPPAAVAAPLPAALDAARDQTIVIAALPTAPAATSSTGAEALTRLRAITTPPSGAGLTASLGGPDGSVLAVPPSASAPPLAGLELPLDGEGKLSRRAAFYPPGDSCPAPSDGWGARAASLSPPVGAPAAAPDANAFGVALAVAARRQLSDLVVYSDRYRHISYPMGDVSPLYGVCTDVVIRAYRSLGLDLQALVHHSRIGSGDTSIDHRRVETLRRFFAAFGRSLPVSDFAEDYRPGDVVSYYRPQNTHSRSHIALVSDVVGPSGHLMIIHNRGWGPQLEDGLFVDEITGHYRYSGPHMAAPAVATTGPDAGDAATANAGSPRQAAPGRTRGSGAGKAESVRTPAAAARRREARSGALVVAR